MNAGLGFHWRLCVESIFDPVAFMRNLKDSGIHHDVERISLLWCIHPAPDGETIIHIKNR